MTSAIVRFTAEGMHRWKAAPPHRHYLSTAHRHLFHVEVRLEVIHADREVEFHDLLDYAKAHFAVLGEWSCETAAKKLREAVLAKWPGRRCSVSVFEDGECGALVDEEG